MNISSGFAPIAANNASVLILGTLPGLASLQKQQYYGHPRNAFWPIMGDLFGARPELDYRQRAGILIDNQVAVWDVLQSGHRPGSLDANIRHETININNFVDFFTAHPNLQRLYFNGKGAENLFKKHVFPGLPSSLAAIEYATLPSTSPAYASLNLEQKLAAWTVIKG